MPYLNQVLMIGNLTKDPESRQAGSHTVASFSIALNKKSKGQDGQAKEEVSYVDCEAWDKTANLVMQYLAKGRPVLVQGRLKQDRWQTPEGQNRSKMKVIADNIQFLGQRSEGQGEQSSASADVGDPDVPF